MNDAESKYLEMLNDIVKSGISRSDRTGVGTKSIFGPQLRFSLMNGEIPMITTKKLFSRGVIEELLFFLRGQTDTKILEDKSVNIWQGNTTRKFLDKIGLNHLPEGEMGKMYGHQWRNWGKTNLSFQDRVNTGDRYDCSLSEGIDQISNIINLLKTDPFSRRIVVNAWNVSDLGDMVLAPCHPMFQFYVEEINGKKYLSCQFNMRSSDAFLGLPFNILSYGILTHIIAKTVGMEAKELIYSGGDTHVYSNHEAQVLEQISREPFPFPKMKITKILNTIKDIEALEVSDFEITGYQCHSAIKAEMAV